ncbi:MAG: menaquinone biosynthesis protein [Thermoleophilia bacterium]|nr:menaquinone biosynthesis protein [Thermoleophilia bacterium]
MTVRVGHIRFLNCYPLYYGLEHCGVLAEGRRIDRPGRWGIELVPGVPTELNRWLVEGKIDLGLVSSIAYARSHRQLLLSRNVSISSLGAVDSIQLVTRKPLTLVRSVALTQQSATSIALLKTIFKLRFQQDVAYCELEGPVSEALQEYDAALLIGDQGLEALYFPEPDTICHDLGELWQEWTGLPMVYAVSAAREDFALTNGAELVAVERELAGCVEYARHHLDEVVDSAVDLYRFDRPSLTRYFALLRYDFTEEYQRGLRRFYELAYEAGELPEVPVLRFIDEAAGFAAAMGAPPGGGVAP